VERRWHCWSCEDSRRTWLVCGCRWHCHAVDLWLDAACRSWALFLAVARMLS
jgi:hypothetical protein